MFLRGRNRMLQLGLLVAVVIAVTNTGCGSGSVLGNGNGGGGGGLVPAMVTGTVDVGTAPVGVAVDPTANKVYVANFGNVQSPTAYCSSTGDSVTVIDGATDSTFTIADGIGFDSHNSLALAADSANHTVYTIVQVNTAGFKTPCDSSFKPNYLAVVSGTTFTLAGFPVGLGGLGGIAVDALTDEIYVGYARPNTGTPSGENAAVINGSSNTVASWLTLGGEPAALAVDPASNKIYVALASEIDVIDGTTHSVTKVADVSAAGRNSVAVNPSTNTIYVANSQSNNLTVLDGATRSVTATIPVGTAPTGVDVDSKTNFIYVANAGNSGDPGSVTVINGSTNATTTLVDPKATNPVAVAVNSATHKVYVANKGSNNVTVIDGAHD